MSHTPWKWWTSNSWKRLKDADGNNVLEPYVCTDGQADLQISEEHMRLIEHTPALLHQLKEAAIMLGSVAADLEDGIPLDMRGKVINALIGARDDALEVVKEAEGK